MPSQKPKGFAMPWKVIALVAGPILLLGVLGVVLVLWMTHRDDTSYDSGRADPTDFSAEEAAIEAFLRRTGSKDTAIRFGPNYRFTKGERDRKRLDPGFMLRMRTLRKGTAMGSGRTSDHLDPPATAIRVLQNYSQAFGGRSEDRIFLLDSTGDLIMTQTNRHGDDWIPSMVPDWR